MTDNDATLEPISYEECLELLRGESVGRVAFQVDDFPMIFPVNYRIMETSGRTWIALRTRPGNVIERAPRNVAFEVDSVDTTRRSGWSVLARGTLHAVDPDAADFRECFDPEPWIETERDSWLVIDPFAISGRRLRGARPLWAFHEAAYL